MLIPRVAMICSMAFAGGCGMLPTLRCTQPGQLVASEMLYFGTTTSDGVVAPQQWADFLSDVVTPRFPQGFTSWQASGQWQSANGQIIREGSHVLAIDHRDDPASDAKLREIMALYKSRFQQEAVLRVRSPACTTF